MSESQNHEDITVTADGVTVRKVFEPEWDPFAGSVTVPGIEYHITVDRREPVTVTIVDDVPETVAAEDIGFHPKYFARDWTVENDTISFKREINADEQCTTAYEIPAADAEQFLTQPEIADVDPPLGNDQAGEVETETENENSQDETATPTQEDTPQPRQATETRDTDSDNNLVALRNKLKLDSGSTNASGQPELR